MVADEPEGEADQDRRQGRQPRPLRRIPNGRGRYPTANVPGDSAAHCRTPAAAAACTGMRCSLVMRSRATDAARPPLGLPGATAAVRTAHLSCQEARMAPISTLVREPSGESRFRTITFFSLPPGSAAT